MSINIVPGVLMVDFPVDFYAAFWHVPGEFSTPT
jgi:hypothetical protein|tara:strand:- start:21822 stop:21923 length:102 start_codon:yes stop_codon:yes gene_type:complete